MPDAIQVSEDDLDVVARTLYGESRGEPIEGQIAVAWVIRNRASWQPSAWWGSTPRAACLYPFQFSCWNKADPNRQKLLALDSADPEYVHLRSIAQQVMAGECDDPTSGATHYERLGTNASWATCRAPNATIGNHAFYRIGPSA